ACADPTGCQRARRQRRPLHPGGAEARADEDRDRDASLAGSDAGRGDAGQLLLVARRTDARSVALQPDGGPDAVLECLLQRVTVVRLQHEIAPATPREAHLVWDGDSRIPVAADERSARR